jgi:hypothetical protein
VLLLAALADAEGDADTAIELIVEMGAGRSPVTIKYGEALAERLGVEPDAVDWAATSADDVLGIDRALAAVRRETARRGWTTGRPAQPIQP